MNMAIACDILLWISQLIYSICLVPQIFTNYREKSGAGVSSLFLFGFFNLYFTMFVFIVCLDLPLAYKLCIPFQLLVAFILILQRLHYDTWKNCWHLWLGLGANIALCIGTIFLSVLYPIAVGSVLGWVGLTIGSINQIPQVIKLYKEKSVHGFNFSFVLLIGAAAFIESISAIMLCLPLPTLFSALRNIVFVTIFSIQFAIYKD